MLRVFPVLALALSIAVGTAYAQDGQKKDQEPPRHRLNPEELFKLRDKDHNGTLSLEEFVGNAKSNNPERAKMLEQRFKTIDANGDGSVTLEELKAAREKQMQNMGKHYGPHYCKRPPLKEKPATATQAENK
ncbi:MAG TPA: EF-hand domain-containing protein [Thermoguttaceae bacterium]